MVGQHRQDHQRDDQQPQDGTQLVLAQSADPAMQRRLEMQQDDDHHGGGGGELRHADGREGAEHRGHQSRSQGGHVFQGRVLLALAPLCDQHRGDGEQGGGHQPGGILLEQTGDAAQ
jgi:hypothetical protein